MDGSKEARQQTLDAAFFGAGTFIQQNLHTSPALRGGIAQESLHDPRFLWGKLAERSGSHEVDHHLTVSAVFEFLVSDEGGALPRAN